MFVLPKRLVCNAGTAAFAAAVSLITAMAALAADASHIAAAQGRLEAEYVASIAGIPIGRGNWVVEISDKEYTVAASGATTGILRLFHRGAGYRRLARHHQWRAAGTDELCGDHHRRPPGR